MNKLMSITDATFADQVLRADLPVSVEFGADWCSSCRMIMPVLDSLADELADELVIGQVDVDANFATAQAFNIMSLPMLILFQGARTVVTMVGFQPKESLKRKLQLYLNHVQPNEAGHVEERVARRA